MKNNEYKEALSGVKPSDERIEKYKSIAESGDVKIKKVNFSSTKTFRRIVSIAASFAIFVGIFSFVFYQKNAVHYDTLPSGISTFANKDELRKYLKKSGREDGVSLLRGIGGVFEKAADSAVADGELASNADLAPTMAAAGSVDYGVSSKSAETYTQEAGVDEADIIKTYGDLVFFCHTVYDDDYYSHNYIDVFRVRDGKETLIKRIDCKFEDEEISICDMYVSGNRLVVNGIKTAYYPFYYRYGVDYAIVDEVIDEDAEYAETEAASAPEKTTVPPEVAGEEGGEIKETVSPEEDSFWEGTTEQPDIKPEDRIAKTVTFIYDISNPADAKLIKTFAQSGSYVSSRMIGETLYLVSDFYAEDEEDDETYYIPSVFTDGKKEVLDSASIAFIPENEGKEYIVASAIDTAKAVRKGDSKAMIGDGFDVYCSLNNLYIYGTDWRGDRPKTEITKLSLGDGIEFSAQASVTGEANDQYSFSERGDNLFVCLTLYSDSKETNVLRVLDPSLKEVAKTEYFATTESIKAVKYIGNYAYVITYEQTDPLFVIDISNPLDPKLLGHALVSGFSTMLVDVGGGKLLGIGYCTGEYDYVDMEVKDGVKFTLFDISDPLKPTVLDEKEYKNIYSTAQGDPKAFVQDTEKGLYAISYTDDYEGNVAGALVVSIENGKIVERKNFAAEGEYEYDTRLTFVDDWYYVIDNDANFFSFRVDN